MFWYQFPSNGSRQFHCHYCIIFNSQENSMAKRSNQREKEDEKKKSNLKKSVRCEMRTKSILLCGFIVEEKKTPRTNRNKIDATHVCYCFVDTLWMAADDCMVEVLFGFRAWFLSVSFSFSSLTTPIAIACSNGLIMTLRIVFTNQLVVGVLVYSAHFVCMVNG